MGNSLMKNSSAMDTQKNTPTNKVMKNKKLSKKQNKKQKANN